MADKIYDATGRDGLPIVRIRAPNPSPMTGSGTNTYIVGHDDLIVIDPGPEDRHHLAAILSTARLRGTIRAIVVTHAHIDHTGLSPELAKQTGAPVLAFDPMWQSIRNRAIEVPRIGGGEGVDRSFSPDEVVRDGALIANGAAELRVVHTPGHLGGHICLVAGSTVFSGDHAMGWSTSIVSPPEGDMTDYLASLERLMREAPTRLLPGHGETVENAPERLAELLAHRRAREASILASLGSGDNTARGLARLIYTDTPAPLMPAAERNVLAHLIDLTHRNLVQPIGPLTADATFARH